MLIVAGVLRLDRSSVIAAKLVVNFQNYLKQHNQLDQSLALLVWSFLSSDNRLDSMDRLDLIKCMRMSRSPQPDCVYVHHAGDVNVDHRPYTRLWLLLEPSPDHSEDFAQF